MQVAICLIGHHCRIKGNLSYSPAKTEAHEHNKLQITKIIMAPEYISNGLGKNHFLVYFPDRNIKNLTWCKVL
jgi:hypothetical protein